VTLAVATLAAGDSWWLAAGLPILITLVVAVVITIVARVVVGRFRRKLEAAPSLSKAQGLQRAATLADALTATIIAVVWTVAVLIVLGYLNVSLAPLIASAGIAGVALGFGAQSIVRDALTGFFILLENQFGVGDTIELQTSGGAVSGRVETFTLRSTMLRAFDGTLHVVPNGNIQIASNKSRGWARAIVDTRIAYGQDPEQVRAILDELFEELRRDEQLAGWVMDGPTVLGVETTGDYAVVIRAVAETRPSKRVDTERLLRERITQRLAERGVRAPTPPGVAPQPGGSG
jgi:small conductance mechanosensitive channel